MALNRPSLYRIHEPPDERRLQEYRQDVLSHRIPCGNLSNRREVQTLLHKLAHVAIGQALKIGFLRSLMRARYAVEPLGHYGLAKKKYHPFHFAHSPVRRFGGASVPFRRQGSQPSARNLHEIAAHLSETERTSDDAERDSRDVKLFAFLGAQLKTSRPERYRALVTDVRNFGFFVDVRDLGMNGLVPLSGLTDDFYQFDPRRAELQGRRTHRVFKLGDTVEVQVAKVDTFKRQVDYALAGTGQTGSSSGRRRGGLEKGPASRSSRARRGG